MSVYIDPTPIVVAIIAIGGSGVGFLVKRAEKREVKHSAALENVRTDIKGDVGKWSEAVIALTANVSRVESNVSFLMGVRSGEESARAQHQS